MTIEEIEQSIASYGEDVFRFCCYLTGNRSSAEDLYQDTFLKAMEITRPVEPDMAGKFLAGVAANLWIPAIGCSRHLFCCYYIYSLVGYDMRDFSKNLHYEAWLSDHRNV